MISETLLEKINNFRKNNQKDPSAIYLGYEEIYELKKSRGSIFKQTVELQHENEFCGIRIYSVTEKNHIGIS